MSDQVTTAHVEQFRSQLTLQAQQMTSKLESGVSQDGRVDTIGKRVAFDLLGPVEAIQKTSRHMDTPLVETPHDRRWATPVRWVWADLIDPDDAVRILTDAQGGYAKTAVAALNRRKDEILRDSFFAAATSGEDADSSVSFPSGQQVVVAAHDFDPWATSVAAGDVSLTVGKLLEARALFGDADVDLDAENLQIAVRQRHIQHLMREIEATSSDFASVKALVNGEINTFMGFNFRRYENLDVDGSSDDLVPVWAPSGIGLGMAQDIQVKVDIRPDKNYAVQVWAALDMGAVRKEEVKVVQIACDPG
ncbi:MAG: phage capsid protein [Dehalococcoidales bacterium]